MARICLEKSRGVGLDFFKPLGLFVREVMGSSGVVLFVDGVDGFCGNCIEQLDYSNIKRYTS